ncbi:MAG: sigma-70 family RNA polymerase sigma factor [Alphaproteobacteria bacterium]|nr:MAG: sigma-70 family RNA polymerase sigma factor [Alphaproteobacteria bacterium]
MHAMAKARPEAVIACGDAAPTPAPPGAGRSGLHSALVARLYREHNDALLRFLHARLLSVQDAHEVAQEAYVRMMRLDQPETISHLQAYLFKIASNIAVDRARRKKRAPECSGLGERLLDIRCPMPAPDAVLDARQRVARIRQIVAELPPKCRLAFLLYKFEGLGYRDIAARMGLTESMIRKYVLRAVVYCRERLE